MDSLILDDNQLEKIRGLTSQFPYTCAENDYRGNAIPWHWHEEFEFKYVREGSMKVTTEQHEYLLQKGEACFTNSDVLETSDSGDPKIETRVISHLFHPVLLGGHYQSVFEKKYIKPVMNNRQIDIIAITPKTKPGAIICKKLDQLWNLRDEKNVEFRIRNHLSEIWMELMTEIDEQMKNRPASSIPSQDRIRYMLKYIHTHYPEKITLDEIAASANISEREALRTFRKVLDKTPFDYLTEYRLGKAREFLTETEDSITEIALNTGFSDSAYFGKLFRKYHNCTPGTYRKEQRKSIVF